jgi:tRNA (mo5U34)-methyltransferase
MNAIPDWFHKLDLGNGLVTPGWSDPVVQKLPYFGLPGDMTGMRVLDVGASEGFFSFEAERRGAAEVVAVDAVSMERFIVCRDALDSKAHFYSQSVYELDAQTMGTFDLVMFFGLFYHLRHPLMALDRLLNVCSGSMLIQTLARPAGTEAAALFLKDGIMSGPTYEQCDPTVFFVPNQQCVVDMLEQTGFTDVKVLMPDTSDVGVVASACAPSPSPGRAPTSPVRWS